MKCMFGVRQNRSALTALLISLTVSAQFIGDWPCHVEGLVVRQSTGQKLLVSSNVFGHEYVPPSIAGDVSSLEASSWLIGSKVVR